MARGRRPQSSSKTESLGHVSFRCSPKIPTTARDESEGGGRWGAITHVGAADAEKSAPRAPPPLSRNSPRSLPRLPPSRLSPPFCPTPHRRPQLAEGEGEGEASWGCNPLEGAIPYLRGCNPLEVQPDPIPSIRSDTTCASWRWGPCGRARSWGSPPPAAAAIRQVRKD